MGKRQALAEYHRGSILAAAERLFAEKGTEGTTMDDIAREAEYSKATLYVYFQSKEEIVGAILLNGLSMLKKRVHQAAEGPEDWLQGYDAVCRAILDFYAENPTAYDAVMGNIRLGTEWTKSEQDVRRVVRELCQELSDFLRRGIDGGLVSPGIDPTETALLFWAAASGMIHMADRNLPLISERTGKDRGPFLASGFRLLLQAITEK